jgi:hypothetical protein
MGAWATMRRWWYYEGELQERRCWNAIRIDFRPTFTAEMMFKHKEQSSWLESLSYLSVTPSSEIESLGDQTVGTA